MGLTTICLPILYGFLFLVGFCGNVGVLTFVLKILKHQKDHPAATRKNQFILHVYYYVLALSTVDLFVLCVIPIVIIEMSVAYWPFDRVACKIFWAFENINKVLSISILTVLSLDRYLAVCQPLKWPVLRTGRAVAAVLLCCCGFAVLLLTPVFIYSDVHIQLVGMIGNETLMKPKCSLNQFMPVLLFRTFIIYFFICGFIIPAALIFFSYSQIMTYVNKRYGRSNHRNMHLALDSPIIGAQTPSPANGESMALLEMPERHLEESHPSIRGSDRSNEEHQRRKALKSVLRVVIFHFVCWTPFWLSVLVPLFARRATAFLFQPNWVIVLLLIHALPYVNSAFNWVFYVLLNKEIRETAIETIRPRSAQKHT